MKGVVEGKLYRREIMLKEKKYLLYAFPDFLIPRGETEPLYRSGGYSFILKPAEEPLKFKEPLSLRVVSLPDEHSIFTMFLFGEKRRIADEMVEIARRKRAARSRVKCFHPGCRKDALFYVDKPPEEGCWFACSKEHMSDKTTQGFPAKETEYIRMESEMS